MTDTKQTEEEDKTELAEKSKKLYKVATSSEKSGRKGPKRKGKNSTAYKLE